MFSHAAAILMHNMVNCYLNEGAGMATNLSSYAANLSKEANY